jgi:hypothetical protein
LILNLVNIRDNGTPLKEDVSTGVLHGGEVVPKVAKNIPPIRLAIESSEYELYFLVAAHTVLAQ